MRKKILFFIGLSGLTASLAILSFSACAQKSPCKYLKQSTDPFTKKVTGSAYMAVGAGLAGRELILQESEGKYYLTARITYSTDFADVPFKKTDKVSIMLASNELIEISPKEDVTPNVIRMLDVPIRQWIVNSEVPKSTYEKMANSQITAIKYTFNGSDYHLAELKDRQTKKIMETAACMLANQ
ncbi:MAG TPA: hypothetical protein VL098_03205 [Flavipsychrobacter sp.]|nr:hypothetical protein [Flavipsychrobacter sp.]